MSMSYEIFDPSLHMMVDKSSDQITLMNENKKLKNLNTIILAGSFFVLSMILISVIKHNNKADKK